MRTIVALRDFVGAARKWVLGSRVREGPRACKTAQHAQQHAVVVAARQRQGSVKEASRQRQGSVKAFTGALGAVRGYLAEVHHAESFNLDAIRKGLPYRAVRTADGGPADIVIYHLSQPSVPLARAQVKTWVHRSRLVKAMGHPKYDGMQKVVNAGAQDPARGLTDHLEYGGASSSPISTRGLEDVVLRGPRAYFNSIREQAASSRREAQPRAPTSPPAVWAVLCGTVAGAAIAAGATLVRALLRNGTLT